MEVGDIVVVDSIFGTKWDEPVWKITVKVTEPNEPYSDFRGKVLSGITSMSSDFYFKRSAIIKEGEVPAGYYMSSPPIISGMPLLGEADPELERLLAEEEEIEKKHLAAKHLPLVPIPGQIVKVSGIPATSKGQYEHYALVLDETPATSTPTKPKFFGTVLGGGYLAGNKVWYYHSNILDVSPQIHHLVGGQSVTLMGVPGNSQHDGQVHHGTVVKTSIEGMKPKVYVKNITELWDDDADQMGVVLWYYQKNLVPDGFTCSPADWALISGKTFKMKATPVKLATPAPPVRVRIDG